MDRVGGIGEGVFVLDSTWPTSETVKRGVDKKK